MLVTWIGDRLLGRAERFALAAKLGLARKEARQATLNPPGCLAEQEGRLGFWRWLSLFLGVAGTYRKNDTVDVVYDDGGRRTVVTLQPESSSE